MTYDPAHVPNLDHLLQSQGFVLQRHAASRGDVVWLLEVDTIRSIQVTAIGEATMAENPPHKRFRIAWLELGRESEDHEAETPEGVMEVVRAMQHAYTLAKVKADSETRARQGKSELLRTQYVHGRHRVRFSFRDDEGTVPMLFVSQNDVSVIAQGEEDTKLLEFFWDDIRTVALEPAKS